MAVAEFLDLLKKGLTQFNLEHTSNLEINVKLFFSDFVRLKKKPIIYLLDKNETKIKQKMETVVFDSGILTSI